MTVASITDADIAAASREGNLDDAVRALQDRAGIKTGDVAALFFTGDGDAYERWTGLLVDERAHWLRQYLSFEAHYER